MYSGGVPDYIRNISSPIRKRHFDSLIKKAQKVIVQHWSSLKICNRRVSPPPTTPGRRILPCWTSSLDKKLCWVGLYSIKAFDLILDKNDWLFSDIFPPFVDTERSISMGPVEFVSSLGGLFGLFLGFSLISFFEIIYWASVQLIRNIVRSGRALWSLIL